MPTIVRPVVLRAPRRARLSGSPALVDALAVLGALVADRMGTTSLVGTENPAGDLVAWLLVVAGWLLVARPAASRPLDGLPRLLGTVAIHLWLVVSVTALAGGDPTTAGAGRFGATLLVLLMLSRAVRETLRAPERVAVVGDGQQATALVRRLGAGRDGMIVTAAPSAAGAVALARAGSVDRVLVFARGAGDDELTDAVGEIVAAGVVADVVMPLSDVMPDGACVRSVAGLPVLAVAPAPQRGGRAMAKRALDIVLAGGALLVLAPLMALISALVRIDSPGPAFFRQPRVGRDGRRFEVVKFRSMRQGAHAERATTANDHSDATGDDRMFKAADDPRVTLVGRVLRKTSLDELPQLINVVRGDMSLVGPRPLIEEEDRFVEGRALRRRDVAPGISGLWQVNGRSEVPFGEMVQMDQRYVAGWSVWSDVKLIARTLPAIAGGRGAC